METEWRLNNKIIAREGRSSCAPPRNIYNYLDNKKSIKININSNHHLQYAAAEQHAGQWGEAVPLSSGPEQDF